MKKIKQTLQIKFMLLKYRLGYEIKIEDSEAIRKIAEYFMINDWKYRKTIGDIKISESKKFGKKIIFTTHEPGLLIGKRGGFIDGLRDFLKKELGRAIITIDIKENKLWHNCVSEYDNW